MRVTLGGRQPLVAEQLLNGAQVGTLFQHVCAECVPQSVRVYVGRKTLGDGDAFNDAPHAARRQPAAALVHEQRGRALLHRAQKFLAPWQVVGERVAR